MSEALSNVYDDDFECRESNGVLDGGWDDECLVYHDIKGRDITVKEAIEMSKEHNETARKVSEK